MVTAHDAARPIVYGGSAGAAVALLFIIAGWTPAEVVWCLVQFTMISAVGAAVGLALAAGPKEIPAMSRLLLARAFARVVVGVILFLAVVVVAANVSAILLYEFIFGDDRVQFVWPTALIAGTLSGALALVGYIRRLLNGGGRMFVGIMGALSLASLTTIFAMWFADRVFHW
jgi:hypothetical protein